jgi:hypothetical protein
MVFSPVVSPCRYGEAGGWKLVLRFERKAKNRTARAVPLRCEEPTIHEPLLSRNGEEEWVTLRFQ